MELADRILDPGSEGERLDQTSDISSLDDSGEESGKDTPPLSISMKRKRSSFEEDTVNDQDIMREPSTKAMRLIDNDAAGASAEIDARIASDVSAVDRDVPVSVDTVTSPGNEEQPTKPQALPKQKHKKGKRKGKKTPNDEHANAENAGSGAESTAEHGGSGEAVYSNEEDAQMENMAEGVEVENPIKVEERKRIHDRFRKGNLIRDLAVVEKKSAMDSLSAIEKCFAKLRDK